MKLQNILGILVVISVVLALITPVLMVTINKRYTQQQGFVEFIESFMNKLVPYRNVICHYEYNVSKGLNVVIEISGGSIEVKHGIEAHKSKVVIYESSGIMLGFMRFRGLKRYNVDYDVKSNVLKVNVRGYHVELLIPRSIKSIRLYVNGGIAKLDIRSSELKSLEANLSSGTLEFGVRGAECLNLTIDVSGGVIDGDLELQPYTGTSNVTLSLSGGAMSLNLKIPSSIKVKCNGIVSAGIASVNINGIEAQHYIDMGYDKAHSKLHIMYRVSSGVADIKISR